MARKNVGLRYGEFEFPAEQGFSGSAGVQQVRGYQRGGRVKKQTGGEVEVEVVVGNKTTRKSNSGTMTKTEKAKGGRVKKQMGGYMGPAREIEVDDVKISVPKKRGGSVHDKLKKAGKEMGYAYGGYAVAKDTSSEFKAKRGPQDDMDHGVQPARRGRTQQEIEAGGTKRLKPGLKKGGRVPKGRGSSRKNPIKLEPGTKLPPPGSWVRLPDGRVVKTKDRKGYKGPTGQISEAERRLMERAEAKLAKPVKKARGGLARVAGDMGKAGAAR